MNEHLAELGVDVWVSWQVLPGAAPTELDDFIQVVETPVSVEQHSSNSVPVSGAHAKPIARSTSQTLGNSSVSISPAASIAAASGLGGEPNKQSITDDSVAKSKPVLDKSEEGHEPPLKAGFAGNFIFFMSKNLFVVADGVESHLHPQVISLLRAIIDVVPNSHFNDGQVFQFNWPPFSSKLLPGQDDQTAVSTLVGMFANEEGGDNKVFMYFGHNLSSYLNLQKTMPLSKRKAFGKEDASDWCLLPSLQQMLISAEEKRAAWRLIRAKFFDSKAR